MSIDRIGKNAVPNATPGVTAAEPAASAAEPFRVEGATSARDAGKVSPLDRLKAGEIDTQQYLDLRVEQATVHLEGSIPAERLEFIREALREQLETDPMLVELVGKAAGSALQKPNDGR